MDPEQEAAAIIDQINGHDCMSPRQASKQESLRFLEAIIDDVSSSANALREDIEKENKHDYLARLEERSAESRFEEATR